MNFCKKLDIRRTNCDIIINSGCANVLHNFRFTRINSVHLIKVNSIKHLNIGTTLILLPEYKRNNISRDMYQIKI